MQTNRIVEPPDVSVSIVEKERPKERHEKYVFMFRTGDLDGLARVVGRMVADPSLSLTERDGQAIMAGARKLLGEKP